MPNVQKPMSPPSSGVVFDPIHRAIYKRAGVPALYLQMSLACYLPQCSQPGITCAHCRWAIKP